MTFKQYFKRALSLPPHVVILKVYQLILFKVRAFFRQLLDSIRPTYAAPYKKPLLQKVFQQAPSYEAIKQFSELPELIQKTLRHEFDLLGSDWVHVRYGMKARGLAGFVYHDSLFMPPQAGETDWIASFINKSNQLQSQSVWRQIKGLYQPIDWHIDFKSGYRWQAKTWWNKIAYGHKPGVDIKVPWEISRCHHLAWLAMGYQVAWHEGNKQAANQLATEFQNQILDFIATNPPRYGVNWRCAMDVAIRSANWILAYDWFTHYGENFSDEFKHTFANSLFDHGQFIFAHLEIGKDGFRGNHYLADICGLAFIANFLPKTDTTDNWLKFSFKALVEEMDYQFFDEGTNFEGSTSYHRLSSEMMLYTSLLFLNGPYNEQFKFSDKHLQKLLSLGQFSEDVLKANGEIVQIGDCDNGRFFKIQPLFYPATLTENHLNHTSLTNAIKALSGQNISHQQALEASWIKCLNLHLHVKPTTSYAASGPHRFDDLDIPQNLKSLLHQQGEIKMRDIKNLNLPYAALELPHKLQNCAQLHYREFGLYIWKTADSILTFRCGKVGQKERGGHDHNDQLSVEFIDQGRPVLIDPGTAIYTPLPEVRNKYRSVVAHSGPQIKDANGQVVEPCPLDQGLFSLSCKNQSCRPLVVTSNRLAGYSYRLQTVRIIDRTDKSLHIFDISMLPNSTALTVQPNTVPYSAGYGIY